MARSICSVPAAVLPAFLAIITALSSILLLLGVKSDTVSCVGSPFPMRAFIRDAIELQVTPLWRSTV